VRSAAALHAQPLQLPLACPVACAALSFYPFGLIVYAPEVCLARWGLPSYLELSYFNHLASSRDVALEWTDKQYL
jgi:hypothetical protein